MLLNVREGKISPSTPVSSYGCTNNKIGTKQEKEKQI